MGMRFEALNGSYAIAFADTYATANVKSLTSGGVGGNFGAERYTSSSEGSIHAIFPSR